MKKAAIILLAVLSSPALAESPTQAQDAQGQFAALLASNVSTLLANVDILKRQVAALQDENNNLKTELEAAKKATGHLEKTPAEPAPTK